MRARDVLGKFTFVPTGDVGPRPGATRGPTHLTQDWRARQGAGPLEFDLRWIRFLNDDDTSLVDLTRPWESGHEVTVGPSDVPEDGLRLHRSEADTCSHRSRRESWKLAGSVGARAEGLPSTRFTAARQFAYRASQDARGALAEDQYASFFERGEISSTLAGELYAGIRRNAPAVIGCRMSETCRSRDEWSSRAGSLDRIPAHSRRVYEDSPRQPSHDVDLPVGAAGFGRRSMGPRCVNRLSVGVVDDGERT